MRLAITRGVSPAIVRCELTHVRREPIDVDLARRQHRDYESCLADLGCRIHRLPDEPDMPDSVFVEDAAVVLDEVAILTRPGAPSRRREVESVGEALGPHRPVARLRPPARLDGGDVLRVGRMLHVGISGRTDGEGVRQLTALVRPHGYRVEVVAVRGCLHLKSAATLVAQGVVLVNPEWLPGDALAGTDRIEVAPSEPTAANALLVGDTVVFPSSHRETGDRLRRRGIRIRTVEVSELAKAEGGVTCCSLVFEAGAAIDPA